MGKAMDKTDDRTSSGIVAQITLPNGKLFYSGVSSVNTQLAEERGFECRRVKYSGACSYYNINERAHKQSPIQIEGVSVAIFLDKIATTEDFRLAIK